MPLLRGNTAILHYSRLGLPRPHLRCSSQARRPFSVSVHIFQTGNGNDQDKKSSLMDRGAVNTESNEYSQTASDGVAAEKEDPAFEPGNNDPKSEMATSQHGAPDGTGPLNVSPANRELSKPRDEQEGVAKGPERTQRSAEGGARKNRKVG